MDEEYGDENDIDPSLFLDNSHVDKKDEVDGSPPSILSSLGLQASGINPLSFLVSDEFSGGLKFILYYYFQNQLFHFCDD